LGAPRGAWMPPPPPGTEVDRIRTTVGRYFPVYETRVTPNSLVLLVHIDAATLEDRFDRLRQDLWAQYYIPQVRYDRGEHVIEVVRRPARPGWSSITNLVLLFLTVATTVTAGAFLWVAYTGGSTLGAPDFLWGGIFFGLPLMAILGLHELAHFVTARRHHVDASLPYFIPVPPPFILFGTFGAFISLREPIPNKKALLDIGASGPLAGFAVSIPVTLLGMYLSAHGPVLSVANCGPSFLGVSYGNFLIGESFLWFVLGKFLPITSVALHPVELAGWVGLLVTAINLLPAGQLDGGHVFRALLGERARYVSYAAVVLLFGLGVFLYNGWIIFAFLILFLGMRHPPPLNDLTPLDLPRKLVGLGVVAILVTGFVLVPIATPSGDFAVNNSTSSLVSFPPGALMADNVSVSVINQDVVDHGFLVSAEVLSAVVAAGNGTMVLNASELASFEANSTWTVYLPNGNVTTYALHGSFSIPPEQYFVVPAGDTAPVTITYSNPHQATVQLVVSIAEICSEGGPAPISTQFSVS
jgi:membrane-associated protease RseP (regulator of RpoE activity)